MECIKCHINRLTWSDPNRRLNDEKVLQLAKKVVYEVDPDISLREATKGFLEIRMQDNKVMSKLVTHAYGHPENPISEEALVAKFIDCAGNAAVKIPKKNLSDISKIILNLEEVRNVTNIMKCF